MSIGVGGLPDENIDSEKKLIEVVDAACRRAQELMVPSPIDIRSIRRCIGNSFPMMAEKNHDG